MLATAGAGTALADAPSGGATFVPPPPPPEKATLVDGKVISAALVVDATHERVLLLFHRKVQRWLQPGGHVDGDANLPAAAEGEKAESTRVLFL